MDSSNAVLMTQNSLTGKWDVNEYDVKEEHCSPPEVKPLDYGNDILYDLQGNVVDKTDPEREPWLRESQFRHLMDNWH
jgi:primary-amine oxidase